MHISLNHHSGDPLYRQVVEAIRLRIAKGELKPGDQLPSIRELASQLQINSRTVVKAYEELEGAGLVVLQQGRGVFVASNRAALPLGERRKRLLEIAMKMLIEASQVGSNLDEVIEAIHLAAVELEANK